MQRFFCFLIFLLSTHASSAVVWRGKIIDKETHQPIQGVTITNTTHKNLVSTNNLGHFDIEGNEGDVVLFSCPGYRSEQHIIIKGLEGIRLNFAMKLNSFELDEFVATQKFKTQYQADSAERKEVYSRVLARHKSRVSSPVSFVAEKLSRKQRSMFRFQKEFYRSEESQFTDTRYTPELVASLSNLGGDTLAYFMNTYPMPYDYARAATALEIKMWIRYNLKDFMQKTDSLRKLELPLKNEN